MHASDGFLNAGTAAATAVISIGVVGISLRQSRTQLSERQTPIAGLTAAFVFAAQMVTFPVAAGTERMASLPAVPEGEVVGPAD